jgi:hypothetical protein
MIVFRTARLTGLVCAAKNEKKISHLFYSFFAGVEGYCSTLSHSVTHKNTHTHTHTSLIRFPWRRDRPSVCIHTTNTYINITHVPGGIRNSNSYKRTATNRDFRQCARRDKKKKKRMRNYVKRMEEQEILFKCYNS